MKKIIFILSIVLLSFFSISSGLLAAREVSYYEGVCGKREAQTGPDPVCSESQETCYILIHYKDGGPDTWEDAEALFDPFLGTGYIDINGVTNYPRQEGGFFFHIGLKATTATINASSLQQVISYIENY